MRTRTMIACQAARARQSSEHVRSDVTEAVAAVGCGLYPDIDCAASIGPVLSDAVSKDVSKIKPEMIGAFGRMKGPVVLHDLRGRLFAPDPRLTALETDTFPRHDALDGVASDADAIGDFLHRPAFAGQRCNAVDDGGMRGRTAGHVAPPAGCDIVTAWLNFLSTRVRIKRNFNQYGITFETNGLAGFAPIMRDRRGRAAHRRSFCAKCGNNFVNPLFRAIIKPWGFGISITIAAAHISDWLRLTASFAKSGGSQSFGVTRPPLNW